MNTIKENEVRAMLRPEITIENIKRAPTQISFVVKYKGMEENVYVSSQFYKWGSHIGFLPVMKTDDGRIILKSPISQLKGIVSKNSKTGKTVYKMPFGIIWIGPVIRAEINKYLPDGIDKSIKNAPFITEADIKTIGKSNWLPGPQDISNMMILSSSELIGEVINAKAEQALLRSGRKGYNFITFTSAIRETLNSQIYQHVPRTMSRAYKIIKETDIADKIVLPEECRGIILRNNRFISQNDGPQTEESGRVVHLLQDTKIVDRKLVEANEFIPVSRTQATCPYFRHVKTTRMQVRRAAVTQALDLRHTDDLLVESKINQIKQIPGINLHVALMQWGMTMEDGIIVSSSAAEKLVAFKVNEESVEGINLEMKVEATGKEVNNIVDHFTPHWNSTDKSRLVRKGVLAISEDGTVHRTSNKIPSIVYDVIYQGEFVEERSSGGSIERVTKQKYAVRTVTMLKLDIGDKLCGFYHGNKGTVAKIVPDSIMPIINGNRVEIVMTPEICKRGIPSIVMECHDSIAAKKSGKTIVIDPSEKIERNYNICYNKPVFTDGEQRRIQSIANLLETLGLPGQEEVLHGYIRIVRLDHNSSEKLAFAREAVVDELGSYIKGSAILPGVQHILYSKGCTNILNEMLSGDKSLFNRLDDYLDILGLNPEEF